MNKSQIKTVPKINIKVNNVILENNNNHEHIKQILTIQKYVR